MIQVSVNGGKLPTQLSAEAGKSLCTALSQSNLSSAESASPADKPNSGSSLATDAKDADHAPGFHIQSTPPPTPTVWHSIEDTTDEAAVCAGKGLDATEALPRGECPPPFPGSYPGTVWPKSDRPVKPIKVGSPRPRLPHEPKLRFSTIELDAEYDNYPVLARMWLATRDAYEVSDPHDLLTWHNVAIMLDFACWALPRAWAWFTANQRAMYLAARQLAGQVLTGISDALRSWGQYALLCAIEEQRISWGLLPLVLCRFLSSIQELLAQRYTADTVELRTLIDESSRSTIFNLYLRLTVPQGNDKLLRTLLRDSEPFTAFSSISNSKTPHSTAADVLRVSCLFIGEVIESLTQLQLIIVLLFSGNATPVVASMAIVLMQYCISSSSTDTELARVERKERNKLDHRRQALFQIAGGADYRQEVNLFQIGRRLSPSWEALTEKVKAISTPDTFSWRKGIDSALRILLELVPTLTKIAIVIHPAVALRLSTAKVTDDASQWVTRKYANGFGYERYCLSNMFRGGFSALAYCAALDLLQSQENGDFIDYETRRDDVGMRIEAKGLHFTYSGCQEPTLHDINLTVEPGTTLAIVGFNGSGKTTLLRLLLGLMGMEGTTGNLKINGLAIDQYQPSTLFNRMSCCFQEHAKFPESLRFNIGVGDVERFDDDTALMAAAKIGGVEGLSQELGGFDRLLNPSDAAEAMKADEEDLEEEGDVRRRPAASLSRGQWQRIAIGRAFLKTEIAGGVDLCVYDEPTASLDPVAEHDLMERISSLSRKSGRTTTIFVSHRLASVRRADQIAFMEKGRIVELGTHAELLALRGRFFRFWELQSKAFVDDSNEGADVSDAEKAEVDELGSHAEIGA